MTLDQQILALYKALKAVPAKALTDEQYKLLCMLDNLLGV